MLSFSFDEIKKQYLYIESGVRRSIFAPVKRNQITVPGLAGAYLDSTDTLVRTITQPFYIEGVDKFDLKKVEEDLSAWLITDNAKELIFDDEPDRIYYAVVDGSIELDYYDKAGRGTITFICLDPYKYSYEKKVTNPTSFFVDGSVPTDPIVSVTLSEDVTFVAVSTGEKINLIGSPVKQGETAIQPQTGILVDDCSTMTGWTTSSSSSINSSTLAGAIASNGASYFASDYGPDTNDWHGPAVKRSLSQALSDFMVEFSFTIDSTPGANECGSVQVDILDANNLTMANLSLTKHYEGLNKLYSYFAAGNTSNLHVIADGDSENQQFRDTFDGVFKLFRKGTTWTAEIHPFVNGAFQSPIRSVWEDTDGIAAMSATQVQIRFLKRQSLPTPPMVISDLHVWKLNDPADGEIPIIASDGDILEFDHQTDIIRKNGMDITKEKAFIGEYFPLNTGLNTIIVEPSGSIQSVEVKWRDKWK